MTRYVIPPDGRNCPFLPPAPPTVRCVALSRARLAELIEPNKQGQLERETGLQSDESNRFVMDAKQRPIVAFMVGGRRSLKHIAIAIARCDLCGRPDHYLIGEPQEGPQASDCPSRFAERGVVVALPGQRSEATR